MDPHSADNWDIRTVGSLLIIKKPEMLNPVTSYEAETKSYFIRKNAITSISTQITRSSPGRLTEQVQLYPYGPTVQHILPPAPTDRYMYKISLSHPPATTELDFKVKANFERVLLLLGGIINDNPDGLNNKLFSLLPVTNPVAAASAVANSSARLGGGAGTAKSSSSGGRRTRRLPH